MVSHLMLRFIVLVLPLSILAQSYRMVPYTEQDGILQGAVRDMVQGPKGRMWFVSQQNLVSYDGAVWQRHDNGFSGLPRAITLDDRGRIWVSSNDPKRPLFRLLDSGSFLAYDAPEGYLAGGEAMRMVGAVGGILLSTGSQLFYHSNEIWKPILDPEGEPLRVTHMTRQGSRVYIATLSGLYSFENGSLDGSLNAQMPPDYRRIFTITPNAEGDVLWLSGEEWVGQLKHGRFYKLAELNRLIYREFVGRCSAVGDGHGGLILGDFSNIFHFDANGKLREYGKSGGFESAGLLASYRDREGNLWLASRSGIKKLPSMRFLNYTTHDGLLEDDVASILATKGHGLFIGHGKGFLFFDGQDFSKIPFDADLPISSRPFNMFPDGKGGAWAAYWSIGLVHVTTKEVTYKPGWALEEILCVAYDKNQQLIVGGTDGLYRLEGERLVPHLRQFINNISIRGIHLTKSGDLLLATDGHGLMIIRNEIVRQIRGRGEMNRLYCVTSLEDGRILAGSAVGPLEIRDEELAYPAELADITRTVYFIRGSREQLWLGTDHGSFLYDGGRLRHFSSQDGLIGRDCNRGTGVLMPDGRFFIGTDQGLSMYDPRYDSIAEEPPFLNLFYVKVDSVIHGPTDDIRLQASHRDLTFNAKAISFRNERDVVYSSRLVGYDQEWNESRGLGEIRYTHMPPGSYQFEVKARGSDHVWTEVVRSGTIVVMEPLWRRTWFILLIGVCILALVYSVVDYSSSKRYSRFLERQVEQRTAALSRQTVELEAQIEAQRLAEARIQAMNEELEERVAQRTKELEDANRERVENAHYEGMAEIANSIIHNVGNVLNSVSTSGYLIQETVEQSKLQALHKANDMLALHMDDLIGFIQTDPKALQLFQFYLSLGGAYDKERDKLLDQSKLLLERVDAIKNVIAQQHNYASGVYQMEQLDPREMMDVSIAIVGDSLASHHIELVRNYQPVSKIALQKTRFIHTAVNLLKNAKESILKEGSDLREIRISIRQIEGAVEISIADSGGGIAAADMDKIFNHGFTTKKEGHGFGLHSSANAIAEMGGKLWAESRGRGDGACFYMRLPVKEMAAVAPSPVES